MRTLRLGYAPRRLCNKAAVAVLGAVLREHLAEQFSERWGGVVLPAL